MDILSYSIKNLSYSVEDVKIIEDISMDILNGNNYAIVGPNGSGKTTLLNILTQNISKYTGNIDFFETDLSKYSKQKLSKKLAYVPQFGTLNFDFTVYEFIMIGRYPHKHFFEKENIEDEKIVMNILEKFNIVNLADRNIFNLSGGEIQKVLLARALVQQPEVLVLDEPSNHLDITNKIRLLNLITQQKITTITAMHDLNIVAYFFDKIIVLKDKKIYAYGNTKDVINEKMIKEVYDLDSEITFNQKTKNISISFYTNLK